MSIYVYICLYTSILSIYVYICLFCILYVFDMLDNQACQWWWWYASVDVSVKRIVMRNNVTL
jgi:hypothetical protein